MATSKKPKMKDLPKKAVGAKKAAQVKGGAQAGAKPGRRAF
jgi:hypothetical protein